MYTETFVQAEKLKIDNRKFIHIKNNKLKVYQYVVVPMCQKGIHKGQLANCNSNNRAISALDIHSGTKMEIR